MGANDLLAEVVDFNHQRLRAATYSCLSASSAMPILERR
jgi:hypothetical protein